MLECGHSLCTECLMNLNGNFTCAVCKKKSKYTNVNDIPVNYSYMKLILVLQKNSSGQNCLTDADDKAADV